MLIASLVNCRKMYPVAEKHEGQPKGLKLINSAPEINEAATIKHSVNSASIKEMQSAPRGHL